MRKPLIGAAIACAVVVGATVPAAAVSPDLNIIGGGSMKPNRYVKDTMRFSKDRVAVSSGKRISLTNRTGEPHTLSLVRKSQLPQTMRAMDKCYEGGVCGELGQAHEVPEDDGPPGKILVDVGKPGFDRAGDSIIIAPKGAPGSRPKLKFTASSGKKLFYLCAIHPWMQGRVNVVD